uniref:Uncharacterized protein n=1 Tax=Arundo donax TaxID=35708 RepID=A0A0A9HNN7_ARUDO
MTHLTRNMTPLLLYMQICKNIGKQKKRGYYGQEIHGFFRSRYL